MQDRWECLQGPPSEQLLLYFVSSGTELTLKVSLAPKPTECVFTYKTGLVAAVAEIA